MTLTAFCDSCGKKIRVGQEYAGKKVKCLHCGHVLILPSRESFLSDPHVDFSKRSEDGEHGEDGEGAGDVRDMIESMPPPPSPATGDPGDHGDEAQFHPNELARGLQFGFGFWLAATPFLLFLVGVVWMLFRRL